MRLFIEESFEHGFLCSDFSILEFSEKLFHKAPSQEENEDPRKERDRRTDSCVFWIEVGICERPDASPEKDNPCAHGHGFDYFFETTNMYRVFVFEYHTLIVAYLLFFCKKIEKQTRFSIMNAIFTLLVQNSL